MSMKFVDFFVDYLHCKLQNLSICCNSILKWNSFIDGIKLKLFIIIEEKLNGKH